MTRIVEAGKLVFPQQVLDELNRYKGSNDPLGAWARANARQAIHHGTDYEIVREVMARVGDVLDHRKTSGEEADPYVLALGLYLKRKGLEVRIVNEERVDRDDKKSITTACGELGLVPLPMKSFLAWAALWPPSV